MSLTAAQKDQLRDLRILWIEDLRRQRAQLESVAAQFRATFADKVEGLGKLGLDDEFHELLDAQDRLLAEQEEAIYEAIELEVDPEAEPVVVVPPRRPHYNPDPDSPEPAVAAGMRVAMSAAYRNDDVSHPGYWGKKDPRHPDEVDAVGIHVIGVGNEVKGFGTRSAHRRMHDGDLFLARGERYKDLEYTTIFSWSDFGHWINLPFWAYAYASSALNRRCISWVYDGQWPRDRAVAQEIVEAAIASLLQTLEDLWDWKVLWNEDESVRAKHRKSKRGACDPMKPVSLLAHRQGDKDRPVDPGAQLWTRVVLEVMRRWNERWGDARFEVVIEPGESWGGGRPLTEEWLAWTPG
jgi:hypothetical protein